MANRCCWDVSLHGEATVTVTQVADRDIDDGQCGYRLTIESAESPTDLVVTSTAETVVATPEQDESDQAVVVTLPEDHGLARVSVRHGSHKQRLFLPGSTLRHQCLAAIDGDVDAARVLLSTFDDPIQVPAMCGAFLDLREIGALIETLGRVNRYTAGRLHSYRYPLVRSAIVSPVGLSVSTADELKTLVEAIDSAESVGSVTLLDSLAEVMATISPSPAQTDQLLDNLGIDREPIKRRDTGFLFTCSLAQRVTTEDIGAAQDYALERQWWVNGEYEGRKTRAENLPYGERDEAWRKLLCIGARQSQDEFAYALANALYWSGEISRSDSRVSELLFEAAGTVAAAIGLEYLEGRARYELTVSKGHRLRSQNCYELATRQFSDAIEIVSEHEFLPDWEPVYARANAHSAALDTAGKHEGAVTVLEDAVTEMFEYDVPEEKLNHIIHHLEGQKLETQAKIADFADESETPATLLEEAKTHYDVIDLARSKGRTEQKLDQAREAAPDTETAAETAETSTTESQTTTTANGTHASTSAEAGGAAGHGNQSPRRAGEHVRSDHARTEFETNPELNDTLVPPDTDEAGGTDLMTSPEDREDDPYTGPAEWGRRDQRDSDRY
jgi:hypothetical protein